MQCTFELTWPKESYQVLGSVIQLFACPFQVFQNIVLKPHYNYNQISVTADFKWKLWTYGKFFPEIANFIWSQIVNEQSLDDLLQS